MPGGVKFELNCRNNTNIQKQKIGREKYVHIFRVMIMSKLVQFSILWTKILLIYSRSAEMFWKYNEVETDVWVQMKSLELLILF